MAMIENSYFCRSVLALWMVLQNAWQESGISRMMQKMGKGFSNMVKGSTF